MRRHRPSIVSRHRLLVDGIDLPERSPDTSDTAAWNYPAVIGAAE